MRCTDGTARVAKVRLLAAGLVVLALAGAPRAAGAQNPAFLTPDDAVRLALEKNVDVLTSAQTQQVAGGRVKTARSSLLPSLALGGNYQNTIEPRFIFTASGIFEETQFWSGRAGITLDLVNFATWGNVRAASSAEDAAGYRYGATRADVVLEATTRYYALLKAEKLAEVSGENLRLTRDQLRRTQALFELGSVAKGDVLKQQVQVSQAELDLIRDRRAILVERARLAQFLGLDPNQPLPIDTTLVEPPLSADSAAVLNEALSRRPEVLESRAQLASASAALGAAQGLRYPTLDGSFVYTFTSPGFPENARQIDSLKTVTLNIGINIPIFDGLNAKGQIQQAKAQELQAEYAQRNLELLIEVEVEEALQAVSLSRERIQVARHALAAADEDLKLSQERYNVGAATVLDLITAQVAWTRARSDYVSALADAHVAVMQVRRVRGETF
jgi:outer membrane protein